MANVAAAVPVEQPVGLGLGISSMVAAILLFLLGSIYLTQYYVELDPNSGQNCGCTTVAKRVLVTSYIMFGLIATMLILGAYIALGSKANLSESTKKGIGGLFFIIAIMLGIFGVISYLWASDINNCPIVKCKSGFNNDPVLQPLSYIALGAGLGLLIMGILVLTRS